MGRLNVLVLHRLGDANLAPMFLRRHVHALQLYCPEHNYIYHDVELPLPDFVRDLEFDAIVLDVTFLCLRWAGAEIFRRKLEEYAFVAESPAVKMAFPQDEYDCHQILDDWMCDWNVDVVFSVISSNLDVLYPEFHRQGEIRLGFTGYIDEALVDFAPKPFDQRRIEIGYRARKLAPYFGRIGEIKWSIGESVAELARARGLKCDIVLGESGTLLGEAWYEFINDSKFTLGSNSGSSLLDPYGKIQRCVRNFQAKNPAATFEEVERHCFAGLDGIYSFTAISPRVLEAGLLESCQILVEGEYSRLISAWEHYIPIKADASDFDDVYAAMQDKSLVSRLRSDCRAALLDCSALRASANARQVIDLIADLKSSKGVVSDTDAVAAAIKKYHETELPKFEKHWRQQAALRRIYQGIRKFPAMSWLAESLRHVYRSAQAWKHRV